MINGNKNGLLRENKLFIDTGLPEEDAFFPDHGDYKKRSSPANRGG
jgi:hypothetical protein